MLTMQDNTKIMVEFRPKQTDQFAFKFIKNETLVIGNCEYCNKKNIMKAICKCKVVKYCDEVCMKKDENFHLDKCSAQADGQL